MKKTTALFLAVCMMVSLAACTGTSAPNNNATSTAQSNTTQNTTPGGQSGPVNDEPITLTFYTYNYSAAQKPGVDKLIEDFRAENPNIYIEVVPGQSDKIQADLAAGITPDVIQLIFNTLDFGVHNFGVQDLNDIVDKDELAAHLEGFEPAALNVAKMDGKLMGLPYTFSTPVLFYNATLFEEAGLDLDAPPTTWEQVKQYSLQIKEKTGKDGVVFGDWNADWLLQAIVKSNGGRVMSSDRKTIQFGEQPAVAAIEVWRDLTKSGAQPVVMDYMEAIESFSAQNLGMLFFTAAMQASMINTANAGGWELRVAKMPTYGDKTGVPVNSGSGLFICATDEARQQAAWKFIKYVTSEAGYTTITSMMGYPPLRPGIVNDERYLKQWAEENPLAGPNLEQLKIVTPWESYPGNNWQQIEMIFMEAAKRCIYGEGDVDVAQVMKAAQDQAQSLMPK